MAVKMPAIYALDHLKSFRLFELLNIDIKIMNYFPCGIKGNIASFRRKNYQVKIRKQYINTSYTTCK